MGRVIKTFMWIALIIRCYSSVCVCVSEGGHACGQDEREGREGAGIDEED